MTGPRVAITIDCHDPRRLAAFWSAALGYVPESAPEGHPTWLSYWRAIGIPPEELADVDEDTWDSIVDPAGERPRVWFQVVPEGKVVKNRLHLDLDVTDRRSGNLVSRTGAVETEVARLVELGASRLVTRAPDGADYYAVVMADPEGNEFCVS